MWGKGGEGFLQKALSSLPHAPIPPLPKTFMLIESLFAAFPVYLRPVFIVALSDKEVPVSMETGTSRMAIKFFRVAGFPPCGFSTSWRKRGNGIRTVLWLSFCFLQPRCRVRPSFRRDFERGGKAIKIAALHEMIHVNDHGGKPIQITGFVVVGYAGRQRGRIERFIQQRIQNLRHIPAWEQRFHGIVDIGPFLVVDVSVGTGGETIASSSNRAV